MRLVGVLGSLGVVRIGVIGLAFMAALHAQDLGAEAWQLESKGEAAQAREHLQRAADASPNDARTLRAYAEFLNRHRDPGAREVYARLATALEKANAPQTERAAALRHLVILDLLAGDRAAANRHVEDYRAVGGAGWSAPSAPPATEPAPAYIDVPGPLRSFARMAALSPDLRPEDLLSALASPPIPTRRWSRPNT